MAEQNTQTNEDTKRLYKEVFGIEERDGRSYWTRIGVAFPNRDGSLTLDFQFLPTDPNVRVHVRDPRPKES